MTPPRGLTKSGIACWWSIKNLIEKHECYLWTLTCSDTLPDFAYGYRHSRLLQSLNDDRRRYGVTPVCGVRVVEEHPDGHGLHYHWVLAGRYPIRRLLARGKQSGFGRISVHPNPCGVAVAPYLCKYLLKNDKLHGVRMWANIGTWEGVGARDIEVDSNSCRVFRDAFRHAKALGKNRGQAYNFAKVTQRDYDFSTLDETDLAASSYDSLTGRILRQGEPF